MKIGRYCLVLPDPGKYQRDLTSEEEGLAEFLRIDSDLLHVAAEASLPMAQRLPATHRLAAAGADAQSLLHRAV